MKTKIVFTILVIGFIGMFGCAPLKNYDTTGFSGSKHTIYYNNQEMATLTNIEYSFDNGKLVKEMTWRLKNQENADKVRNLITYIHNKHKGWEIEIDLPINDTLIF
jgi:hypothetical protein